MSTACACCERGGPEDGSSSGGRADKRRQQRFSPRYTHGYGAEIDGVAFQCPERIASYELAVAIVRAAEGTRSDTDSCPFNTRLYQRAETHALPT
jgi:hypothetical protein